MPNRRAIGPTRWQDGGMGRRPARSGDCRVSWCALNRRRWARIGRPRPYYYRLARFCARVPLRGRLFDWSAAAAERPVSGLGRDPGDRAKKSRWKERRRERANGRMPGRGADPRRGAIARERAREREQVSRYKGALTGREFNTWPSSTAVTDIAAIRN